MISSLIPVVFVLGYLAIAFEHQLHINKAASALFIGCLCWALYLLNLPAFLLPSDIPEWYLQSVAGEHGSQLLTQYAVEIQHLEQTGEIASILFFLMGAMTIVELIDAHEGFSLITDRIQTQSKRKLLWIVGLLTFFLSAMLDNLTTTIVMVSLLKKLIADRNERLRFIGLVVIAANAGGAWTVIGDVTTTMLWIKHRVTTIAVMQELFVASLVSFLVPLAGMSIGFRGKMLPLPRKDRGHARGIQPWHQWLFLVLGLLGLLFVPLFKTVTHLPPYMGIMLSLSLLWVVSEIVGHTFDEQTRSSTGVIAILKRVDLSSILFFLGILLAVGALSATGMLGALAQYLEQVLPNRNIVAVVVGLISSVVDNVPLVAAGIDMYQLPTDHPFWMLLAYCAGTGGSCLIIGSAAGVAAMGMEQINFLWYAKRIMPWALLGYLSGAVVIFATL